LDNYTVPPDDLRKVLVLFSQPYSKKSTALTQQNYFHSSSFKTKVSTYLPQFLTSTLIDNTLITLEIALFHESRRELGRFIPQNLQQQGTEHVGTFQQFV